MNGKEKKVDLGSGGVNVIVIKQIFSPFLDRNSGSQLVACRLAQSLTM